MEPTDEARPFPPRRPHLVLDGHRVKEDERPRVRQDFIVGAVTAAMFLVVRALLTAWVGLAEAWVPKWLFVVLCFFPLAFVAGYHSATAEQGAAYASLARDVLARERASDFDQREEPGVVQQKGGFRRVRSNGDLRRRAGGLPRSSSGSNLRARFRRHQR